MNKLVHVINQTIAQQVRANDDFAYKGWRCTGVTILVIARVSELIIWRPFWRNIFTHFVKYKRQVCNTKRFGDVVPTWTYGPDLQTVTTLQFLKWTSDKHVWSRVDTVHFLSSLLTNQQNVSKYFDRFWDCTLWRLTSILFLAYWIRISACFTWTDNSYLTHVISSRIG